MVKGHSALSNKLLGRVVERRDDMPHHKCLGVDLNQRLTDYRHTCDRCKDPRDSFNVQSCWPFDQEPNLSGQFVATIEAVWREDGTTKALVRSAMSGKMAEVFLDHVNLLEENK